MVNKKDCETKIEANKKSLNFAKAVFFNLILVLLKYQKINHSVLKEDRVTQLPEHRDYYKLVLLLPGIYKSNFLIYYGYI